jgi:hypothetical protein
MCTSATRVKADKGTSPIGPADGRLHQPASRFLHRREKAVTGTQQAPQRAVIRFSVACAAINPPDTGDGWTQSFARMSARTT